MPTPTYTALANITLGSSASSVTFSSIPATYRDLVLVVRGGLVSGTTMDFRINGDTGSNYNQVLMFDGGSVAESNVNFGYLGNTSTTLNNMFTVNVLDYSASDKHKTWLSRGSTTENNILAVAGRWANTTPITSVAVYNRGGNLLLTGTTVALYGIAS